jgi:hypothetical protein
MNCIICKSDQLYHAFDHTYWKKPVHVCKECGHSHLYDYTDNVDEKDYSSNQFRAIKYLQQLEHIKFKNILEVGPTHDFFFCNQYHRKHVETKLKYYDVIELKSPPWIKQLKHWGGEHDFILALHVMEHVINPWEFSNEIDCMGKYFIIEVPNCDSMEHKKRTTNQGHYHGFSFQSFNMLFKDIECVTIKRASGVHSGGNPFVAYRLPDGVHIK